MGKQLFISILLVLASAVHGADSLSLNQAWLLLLNNNENVQRFREDDYQAAVQKRSTLFALLPTVIIDSSFTENKQSIIADSVVVQPQTIGDMRLHASMPIWDSRIWSGFLVRRAQERATKAFNEYNVAELLLASSEAYLEAMRQEELQQVRKAQVTLSSKQEQISTARFRAGEVPNTDVMRAQTEVNRAKRGLTAAENLLKTRREQLGSILGSDVSAARLERPEFLQPEEVFASQSLEHFIKTALELRADIQGQLAVVEAAFGGATATISELLPSLSAEFEYNRVTPETFGRRTNFWTAYLRLNVPLFRAGDVWTRYALAKSSARQEELTLARLRRDVQTEVTDAWLALATAVENLPVLRSDQSLEEELNRVVAERYQFGETTSLEITDAQQRLTLARSNLVVGEYDVLIALLRLYKSAGFFDPQQLSMP